MDAADKDKVEDKAADKDKVEDKAAAQTWRHKEWEQETEEEKLHRRLQTERRKSVDALSIDALSGLGAQPLQRAERLSHSKQYKYQAKQAQFEEYLKKRKQGALADSKPPEGTGQQEGSASADPAEAAAEPPAEPPAAEAAGGPADHLGNNYSTMWYKNSSTVGIREKVCLKSHVMSIGVRNCGKSRDQLLSIARIIVDHLNEGASVGRCKEMAV